MCITFVSHLLLFAEKLNACLASGECEENVIEYFELIIPMTPIGGVIITDNMLYPEKYREDMKKFSEHIKKNQRCKTITSPIGNGEEITIKIK